MFDRRDSASEDSYLALARHDSFNPFEDHDHTVDRKAKIQRFYMGGMVYPDEPSKGKILERLVADISELREEIRYFDRQAMAAGKRYGLAYIDKSLLVQFQRYLEGLYAMIAEKSGDLAITRFKNSLQKTETICNSTARKTLLRMHEILLQR